MIEQENFWAGSFGDEYTERNTGTLENNVFFFIKMHLNTYDIQSVLELGAGIGLNLIALKMILPKASFAAIEINKKAVKQLKINCPDVLVSSESFFELKTNKKVRWKLVFTKGLLIHIAPLDLPEAYKIIYKASNKYILLCEYYNPTPVEVEYRGHKNKLFKRDFAGEMLDMYKDLKLIDYGFVYHRDIYPQDDVTWFLMEKYDRRKI